MEPARECALTICAMPRRVGFAMAKIERILLGANVDEPTSNLTPTPSVDSLPHTSITGSSPGLRISSPTTFSRPIFSRPTTSSLSDYGQFDLRLISGGEFIAVLTDGAVS
jgi:hypothetical protein